MTKEQYIAHLTAVYRQANLADSDSPDRQPWQVPKDAKVHCNAIEKIIRDMMTIEQYARWLTEVSGG